MSIATASTLIVTALATFVAAASDLARNRWTLDNMTKYGVPHSWIIPLGLVKLAGALGLLAGLAIPALGAAAAAGLVLYFIGAVATLARARGYSDLVYPGCYLVLATASLVLTLVATGS
ncbi:DoxX family protein [Nocardia cyriacigeorgica]|uniref:DoxX family protein n=1 Tax=Nocardia cyriacigeorgica TaxID=135487 RepID=UPI0018945384|nr:DoxX family protein [Nocardia cyriacigeorgica]MBF6436860.1 DoxX family protein [Nocardia cyriacigeorgica]MBF6452428.1 DoxX family protein [Nocardia cyriacigeorgica]MBF6482187.1 DoxX family protein [Nocardia cyriacigeorgica]MBF6549597.1 DoxX family protein [Nocardia cyriacigeorgica]